MGKTYPLIVFVLALLLALPAAAHPSHDSFTEIDWNAQGNQLEVAMRIIPEVLEEALATELAHGRRIALENSALSEPLIEAYLQRHFEVRNSGSELMPLKLVGTSIDYAESWLFFTIDATRKDTLLLRHTVLMALENEQINRVHRLWQAADDIQLYTQDKPERLLWQGH